MDKKIPEDHYERKLAEYEKDKKTLKKILDGLDLRVEERIEKLNEDLGFAVTASEVFNNGDDVKRREIVNYLGSNLILTDQILNIQLKKPLQRIQEVAEEVRTIAKRFEPLENTDNKEQFGLYLSQTPAWGG